MVLGVRGIGSPIEQLRNEMNRVFSGFMGNPEFGPDRSGLTNGRTFPALSIWQRGEELVAEAEMPGLKVEDVDIQAVGNELTIKGQRPDQAEDGATYHRRERGVGEFSRTVRLPVEINADAVQATLRDGVLTITLPKSEAAKPRKITVNARK